MQQDYTINDAFKDGFECGLLYILRYVEEDTDHRITANDIARLIIHLEDKKPWKSNAEWETLILNALKRR